MTRVAIFVDTQNVYYTGLAHQCRERVHPHRG